MRYDFNPSSKRNHIIALPRIMLVLIAISLLFSILAYPIYGPLTMTRASLLINVFLIALISLGPLQSVRMYALVPFLIGATVFIYASSFFFVIGGQLWSVISWLFLGALSSSFAILFHWCGLRDRVRVLSYLSILCGGTLTIFGALYFLDGGVFGINYRSRVMLNLLFPNGINRTLTGIFTIVALAIAAFFFIESSRFKRSLRAVFVGFNLIVFLFFAFASGSRQNLLAFAIFIVLIGVVHLKMLSVKRIAIISMFGVTLLFSIRIIGLRFVEQSDLRWLSRRYVDFFVSGELTTGDEIRLSIFEAAIQAGQSNRGFGIGPGNFPSWSGFPAESAYLQVISDFGVIGALLFFSAFFLVITFSILMSRNKIGAIGNTMRVLLVCLVFVSFNFNELLQDSIFWAVFGVVLGSSRGGYSGASRTRN